MRGVRDGSNICGLSRTGKYCDFGTPHEGHTKTRNILGCSIECLGGRGGGGIYDSFFFKIIHSREWANAGKYRAIGTP